MMEASLALQTAIRAQLIASTEVTALVQAQAIFDRSARPEIFPCVVIGDGQTVLEDTLYNRRLIRTYSDLHVWTHEGDLASVKTIVGALRDAMRGVHWSVTDHSVADFKINSTRFLRDPGGQHAHAVVSIEALLQENPT